MNNKLKFGFLSLITLFLLAFKTSSVEEVKKSLLWKIEGNGVKAPSYLFGTMHMIQKEYFYFPSSLEKFIKKSDVILTEIALDKLDDQQELLKLIYLKEGKLMDYFSQEQQDSLYAWAKTKLALEKDAFDLAFGKMKPLILVQTMTQMEFMGKTESYEYSIKDLGTKHKKAFAGLESLSEQISLFDGLDKATQANMVMEGIRDQKKNNDLLTKMQQVYRAQELDSLYQMMHASNTVIMEEESTFLDKRNKNWIPQIKELTKEKSVFIAVGAGHLAGQNGVIELLRKEGFTVSPVKF